MNKAPTIQNSTDYTLFKPHGEQQPMQTSHVNRLISSMKMHGFISANPIHVYKDGKFLRVIDGHHRLRAAQTLGIPVFYVVGDKEDAPLIAVKNWAVRKWNADAFIHMYASRGIESYVKLISYVKRGIPTKFAIGLLANETTSGHNQNEAIRNGTYKIKVTKYAEELIHVMDRLSPINPEARSANFIAAMAVLMRIEEFSSSVLISRIEANPRALVKCATREQMFDLIDEIYNFRSREKIALTFKCQELLSKRKRFNR